MRVLKKQILQYFYRWYGKKKFMLSIWDDEIWYNIQWRLMQSHDLIHWWWTYYSIVSVSICFLCSVNMKSGVLFFRSHSLYISINYGHITYFCGFCGGWAKYWHKIHWTQKRREQTQNCPFISKKKKFSPLSIWLT